MAPYLEPPQARSAQEAAGLSGAAVAVYDDEGFVLPALLRFGGEPVVDEATGSLLYVFPSLQRSGSEVSGHACISRMQHASMHVWKVCHLSSAVHLRASPSHSHNRTAPCRAFTRRRCGAARRWSQPLTSPSLS